MVTCEDVALFSMAARCLSQNVTRFIAEKASSRTFCWELLKGTGGREGTALVRELKQVRKCLP